MKKIDPKIEKIIKYQSIATTINFFLAVIISTSIIFNFLEVGIISVLLSIPLSYVIALGLNLITLVLLQLKMYGFNSEQLHEDAIEAQEAIREEREEIQKDLQQTIKETRIEIVSTPKKPIGKFMDHSIFEWVDVRDSDDIIHRFYFEGTIDMKRGNPPILSPGSIILPPGIIYQVKTNLATL